MVLLSEAWQPIQCMESTTAEVLLRCLLHSSGRHPQLQGWRHTSRAVCTDQAGSNLKAERALLKARGGGSHMDMHSSGM